MYNKMSLGWEIALLKRKYPDDFVKWIFGPAEEFEAALKHFCWVIYQKTSTDSGLQIMGREWDTDPYSADKQEAWKKSSQLEEWKERRKMNSADQDYQDYQDWSKNETGPRTWAEAASQLHGIVGYEKVGPGMFRALLKDDRPQGGLNTSAGARGNVLKMDSWHPVMNDCWVLGGVHRGARFKLVSPRIPANIYNYRGNDKPYPVVTARELSRPVALWL